MFNLNFPPFLCLKLHLKFRESLLCPTLLSCREVLCDVVHGVAHVVLLGDVHVDQAQEGRALHAQPLQDDGSELGIFSHRASYMTFMLKCLKNIHLRSIVPFAKYPPI